MAGNMLVAGALSGLDRGAAENYLANSVGQEVGGLIKGGIQNGFGRLTATPELQIVKPESSYGLDSSRFSLTGSSANDSGFSLLSGDWSLSDVGYGQSDMGAVGAEIADMSPGVGDVFDPYGGVDGWNLRDQGMPASPIDQYTIAKGDTYDAIARRQLGAGATNAQVQQQVLALMQVNQGVDPLRLQVGQTIDLVEPGAGVYVGSETERLYAALVASLVSTDNSADKMVDLVPTIENAQRLGLLKSDTPNLNRTWLEAIGNDAIDPNVPVLSNEGRGVPRLLRDALEINHPVLSPEIQESLNLVMPGLGDGIKGGLERLKDKPLITFGGGMTDQEFKDARALTRLMIQAADMVPIGALPTKYAKNISMAFDIAGALATQVDINEANMSPEDTAFATNINWLAAYAGAKSGWKTGLAIDQAAYRKIYNTIKKYEKDGTYYPVDPTSNVSRRVIYGGEETIYFKIMR